MKPIRIVAGCLGTNSYVIPLENPESPRKQGDLLPVIVVDPGDGGDDIVDALDNQAMQAVAVALTHGHFDHVLGLKEILERFPGISVGLHPLDKTCFGPKMNSLYGTNMLLRGRGALLPLMTALPAADVMLPEGAALACLMPGLPAATVEQAARWKVIHTPGHTAGSICFYNEPEGLLVSGDTLFWGACGRTDLYTGDARQMGDSLYRLFQLPLKTIVYPGHEKSGFELGIDQLW
jgi:glyoxylase-like metal-dependent hydrolase (beta-lactamase superfamily II)